MDLVSFFLSVRGNMDLVSFFLSVRGNVDLLSFFLSVRGNMDLVSFFLSVRGNVDLVSFFFLFFFLFAMNFGNIPQKPYLFWNLGCIINFLPRLKGNGVSDGVFLSKRFLETPKKAKK